MTAPGLPVLLAARPWESAALAQSTTTTTVPGPVIELRGPGAIALIVAVGLALAIMWTVPLWVDARRAYRLRERAVDLVGSRLLDAAKKNGLTVGELRTLLSTIGEPATGQRGLARALMAFTTITIVGVALIALLLSRSADAGDLRKTVITSLLTLLGTIVGFYFGTRAAETSGDSGGPGGPAAPPEAPASGTEVPTPTTPEAPVPAPDVPAPTPTAPVAEEPAPVIEEQPAPIAEGEPAPAAEEDMGPLAEGDTAPLAEEEPGPPVPPERPQSP